MLMQPSCQRSFFVYKMTWQQNELGNKNGPVLKRSQDWIALSNLLVLFLDWTPLVKTDLLSSHRNYGVLRLTLATLGWHWRPCRTSPQNERQVMHNEVSLFLVRPSGTHCHRQFATHRWLSFVHFWRPSYSVELMKRYLSASVTPLHLLTD